MNYLITSFYTENTPYEEEVKALAASIKKLDLRAHVQAIPCLGSWEKNCQHKARFLLEMLARFPGTNLVWVDADAVFKRHPTLFESLDCDLAYHLLGDDNELLSGTLFLKNNERTKRLLEDWATLNASNDEWDQRNLQALLAKNPALNCTVLPADYCKIFDCDKQISTAPVIVHYQASRRFKEGINGNATCGQP